MNRSNNKTTHACTVEAVACKPNCESDQEDGIQQSTRAAGYQSNYANSERSFTGQVVPSHDYKNETTHQSSTLGHQDTASPRGHGPNCDCKACLRAQKENPSKRHLGHQTNYSTRGSPAQGCENGTTDQSYAPGHQTKYSTQGASASGYENANQNQHSYAPGHQANFSAQGASAQGYANANQNQHSYAPGHQANYSTRGAPAQGCENGTTDQSYAPGHQANFSAQGASAQGYGKTNNQEETTGLQLRNAKKPPHDVNVTVVLRPTQH